jgi:uncharacterized membrane protein
MIVLIDSLAIIILIVGWWVAFGSYPRLPETIPVHFGLRGEADGWGRRWMIFLLPIISTTVFTIQYLALNYGMVRANKPVPEEAKFPFHFLLLELTVIFTYITWRTSEHAFGRARGLGVWFLPVTLLGVFATIGWMWLAGRGH